MCKNDEQSAGRRWLIPVILATPEAEIRRLTPGQKVTSYPKNTQLKKGLAEWFKW
jgi:hypothetical protein